jgi:hypothetical protein
MGPPEAKLRRGSSGSQLAVRYGVRVVGRHRVIETGAFTRVVDVIASAGNDLQ